VTGRVAAFPCAAPRPGSRTEPSAGIDSPGFCLPLLQPRQKASTPMTAIKKIRKYLAANPTAPSSHVLVKFVLCLESEASFPLAELYRLDYDIFKLALEMLEEWRLDRYYTAKGQLLDIALQLSEIEPETGE
jgi:hypothetical protein